MLLIPILLLQAMLSAAPPNVVLISVDTLRADHLGCYGYDRNVSPNIDRLAEAGVIFENCVAVEPQTAPSMGAMFSSRYPRTTGLVRNGLRMQEGVPMLAEQFAGAGYETGAVVSNWNLKARLSGFNRGFDNYDDDFGEAASATRGRERDAGEVSDRALAMLAARDPGRPFFHWFHYMDPHDPYEMHATYRAVAGSPWSLFKRKRARARYDSEIAYADAQIGRLLEAIPQDNTFIVFTADHGEGLGEHGYYGHTRHIHQATLHIPLVVVGPRIRPGRSHAGASGLDLAPTLLAFAGLTRCEGMQGRDLFGGETDAGEGRFVETYGGRVVRGRLLADTAPKWQGVLFQGWKLIRTERIEVLYDLSTDPGEQTEVGRAQEDIAKKLREMLDAWSAETALVKGEGGELSGEDIRALDAAGYL